MSATTRDLLLARGTVSPEALVRAEAEAARTGRPLLDQVLALGAADEHALVAVLAELHGVPGVDLSRSTLATDVLGLVPRPVCEADAILPLSTEGGRLHLAIASPGDAARIVAEVRFVTGMEVSAYVALEGPLRRVTQEAYEALAGGQSEWRGPAAAAGPGRIAVVLPGDLPLPAEEEAISEVGEGDLEPIEEPDEGLPGGAPLEEGEVIEIAVGEGEDEILHEVAMGADPAPSDRRRVLVVDDEPEIRQLVEKALAARDFEVETASDGEEALARVQKRPPNLVLLDAMLPKIHGFEVARKLRSDVRTRGVPIVMMTAIYRGWRFAQDARETYGAEDYIEKPFRLDDLLRRVEAVLEATSARQSEPSASAEPLLQRGREMLQAGKVADAVSALEEALAIDPFSAEAHYQLAKALRLRGEHFRAMTAFERSVELRPKSFPALRSLAALYTEKGFRRKAAETLERALAAAPDATTREAIKSDLLELLGA
ncbi:MAG TPA: response regulator [Anaeromyxobacteraceae bacterium]|nr:response regulator [Anaeromyxobacteraceae bacterium]